MRLRTRIQAPERFEDEDYKTSAASSATKPAFPSLLKEQTVAFNPHLPPAAFPSLREVHPSEDGDRISDDRSEPADTDMRDADRSPDQIFLPALQPRQHLGARAARKNSPGDMQDPPVLETSFLDDVATSDEENCEVSHQSVVPEDMQDSDQRELVKTQQHHVDRTGGDHAPSISWTQLAPAIQIEIFENVYGGFYGHANFDILGLSHKELYNVTKHLWARNKQVVAEDQSIKELQQAQLCAILRKDHSSSLGAISWRDHVACTRKHLPHIAVRPNYFICTKTEMELARKFLDERGIDTRVLGEWKCNENYNGTVSQIRTQALQGSRSRDGVDSGYVAGIPKQGTGHFTTSVARAPPHNVLSEISNSFRGSLNGPLSDRRKMFHSTLDTGLDTVASQHQGVDPSTAVVTSAAPSDSQFAGSPMILRARGSHQTRQFNNAISAMMKTRGGGSEDSDDSHEDEHGARQGPSLPPQEINPPEPPRDSQYLNDRDVLTSTRQRAITLKISQRRLEKVQAIRLSDARPSTIRTQEVLTPPTMVTTQNSINETPKERRPRPQQQMPLVREPLTFHDPGKLSAFSLKLLEIQWGAAGLFTPPDRQTVTSPKRLKPNPPQDSIFNLSSDDTTIQAPRGSSQFRRKNSASFQEAPPWSPITQVSNSSRPPSRRESCNDDFQLQKFSLANRPNTELRQSLADGVQPGIQSTPQTPPRTKAHMKPSIARNGSPVLGLSYDIRNSSTALPEGGTHEEAKPKIRQVQVRGSLQSTKPPQTLEQGALTLGMPSRGHILGAPAFTDPLRTYATGLLQDHSNGSRSSPSRRLTETVVRVASKNPPSAKELGNSPASISPAEQVKVDAILSQSPTIHHDIGKMAYIQLPEQISTTKTTSPKKRRDGDDSPTGGQVALVTKASEALVLATDAFRESPQTKTGKDGKIRPRTYVKSQKQIEKEAANAAAKAALGKTTVVGKKTDAKASVASQLAMHEFPPSRPLGHIEAPLVEGNHVGRSEPSSETTISAISKSNVLAEKFHSSEKEQMGLPEVVAPPKQNALALGDAQTAAGIKNEPTKHVPAEDESYEAGTSDASSVEIRKIATPKGKKVAVGRAKAAVQSYQTNLAVRGKSALTDMASKRVRTTNVKAANGHEQPALGREDSRDSTKLNGTADQVHERRTPENATITEADGFGSQGTSSSSKKVGSNINVPSGAGEQSVSRTRKKRSSGLAGESSVPKAQSDGRTKAFRGNQYYYADGTPRPRKDRPTPRAIIPGTFETGNDRKIK
jgi:hypothetical protein